MELKNGTKEEGTPQVVLGCKYSRLPCGTLGLLPSTSLRMSQGSEKIALVLWRKRKQMETRE